MERWRCAACGYIYDPEEGNPDQDIEAGTDFEDLPEEWSCPECGASMDEFEPYEEEEYEEYEEEHNEDKEA